MLERVLEVVGEAGPQAALLDKEHGGGRHDLILVVHQLRQAVLGVADARLQQQLPRRTFSSIGRSSSTGITRLRTWLSSRLSRYSAALAFTRASPCSSDQRAAEMSFQG